MERLATFYHLLLSFVYIYWWHDGAISISDAIVAAFFGAIPLLIMTLGIPAFTLAYLTILLVRVFYRPQKEEDLFI